MLNTKIKATQWRDQDAHFALLEGWDIFESFGSVHGPFQIQFLAEPSLLPYLGYSEPKFTTDDEVWMHVVAQANNGSDLHIRALKYLLENNETEFDAIMKWWIGEKAKHLR